MKKSIEEIARADGRYGVKAAKFVYEGLGYTLSRSGELSAASGPQHISGEQLCEGLRKKAVKRWGRLAKVVLNDWGIRTTRDFGEIVFLMIEHHWMSAQPDDSIEDFDDRYDFQTVFEVQFEFDN